jgi:endo-1,4-beta-xylanase
MTEKIDYSNYNTDVYIKKHRTANATITVLKENHTPLANQEVTVAQRSHKFLFGCTGSNIIGLANNELAGNDKEKAEKLSEKMLKIFNFTTLPFYWGRFEPERGHPETKKLINAAKWFVDRKFVVKGHPLCWHTVTAPWLLEMSNADITKAQVARIKREVTDFAGLVDMWDVVNEAVIMPIFDKYDNGITRIAKELGRVGLIKTMFEAARSANTNAILLLNDFNVSPAYENLIEECFEAGANIDVIGIQSHMHQGYWGVEKTLKILKRFARFNLPIHFTESSIVSGHLMLPEIEDLNDYKVDKWPSTPEGEERQAKELVQHYKTLFAHPAVEAITWWGMVDGRWLNAPSGLIRKDYSQKPAYEALLNLIKGEWWLAPVKMVTDSEGKFQFNGFLGEYNLSCADKKTTFSLEEKGDITIKANL